jgi:outer membrane immunogenic protein
MRLSGRIVFAATAARVVSTRAVSAALATGAILGIGAAGAADIPPRTNTKAPATGAEAYSWTGLYVGGNVGGVWAGGSDATNFFDPGIADPFPELVNNPEAKAVRNTAVMGGFHAGFNWQMAQWVFGAEADFDWTDRKTEFCREPYRISSACRDLKAGFLAFKEKTEWLASARGRLGYAWERVMIYGTGGAAWGKIDTSINANCLEAGCGLSSFPLDTTANFSDTKLGWVAGGGVEAMLNANLIVRMEYLHYDLGHITNTLNLRVDPAFPQDITWSRSLRYNTVRLGLSYKFDGPAAAKY